MSCDSHHLRVPQRTQRVETCSHVRLQGPAIYMRATKVGSETALAQIVRLVQTAQLSKAPIQAFADRVSAVFVPVVVSLAFITWLGWFVAGECRWYDDTWRPEGHSVFLFALVRSIRTQKKPFIGPFGPPRQLFASPCTVLLRAQPQQNLLCTVSGSAAACMLEQILRSFKSCMPAPVHTVRDSSSI